MWSYCFKHRKVYQKWYLLFPSVILISYYRAHELILCSYLWKTPIPDFVLAVKLICCSQKVLY